MVGRVRGAHVDGQLERCEKELQPEIQPVDVPRQVVDLVEKDQQAVHVHLVPLVEAPTAGQWPAALELGLALRFRLLHVPLLLGEGCDHGRCLPLLLLNGDAQRLGESELRGLQALFLHVQAETLLARTSGLVPEGTLGACELRAAEPIQPQSPLLEMLLGLIDHLQGHRVLQVLGGIPATANAARTVAVHVGPQRPGREVGAVQVTMWRPGGVLDRGQPECLCLQEPPRTLLVLHEIGNKLLKNDPGLDGVGQQLEQCLSHGHQRIQGLAFHHKNVNPIQHLAARQPPPRAVFFPFNVLTFDPVPNPVGERPLAEAPHQPCDGSHLAPADHIPLEDRHLA
mmetsp:Transcript_109068/g.188911  ORF Transcript_109068/g.188911 Transcript_109068/m.188911 type:complete len:341 (+) Transcript_109068:304-1326(+)